MHVVSNEFLEIQVRDQGAEIRSIKSKKDGHEYLWNGDPAWWQFSSPTLFPIVGRLKDKQYRFHGRTYSLPTHGFTRTSELKKVTEGDGFISFSLESSEQTLECYPWQFKLSIGYRLEGRRILVLWAVENRDQNEMLFSIGAHPAFRCPLDDGLKFEDCYIEFDTEEDTPILLTTKEGGLYQKKECGTLKGRRLDLGYGMFKDDVLLFDRLRSGSLALRSDKTSRYVKVIAPDFPYWGIWTPTKGGAPFVCIEPWIGRPDDADTDGDFRHKAGLIRLSPAQKYTNGYVIELG